MSRPGLRSVTAAALALTATTLAAGCGSAAPASRAAGARAVPRDVSLDTSLATGAGTWAVVLMGGSAAHHNNFWQLFTRPAGSSQWNLATPPGTADNGGLVVAGDGQALITAFRPSQYLAFTPLIQTTDGGRAWSSLSPLGGRLASSPDAMANGPRGTPLLALLTSGAVMAAAPGYGRWKTLVRVRALAATPAGRRCGLRALTAAAFTASGTALLAGACTRPGTAGIFTTAHGAWQAAGPALPAALARDDIAVLRLTQVAGQVVALLAAGTGQAASLVAAWSADGGRHWAVSPAFRLGRATLDSASFGSGGGVVIVLTGGHGEMIAGQGQAWQALPPLPRGTATLATGPGGAVTALTVRRAKLTIWQARPGGAAWAREQALSVPIQFGSSG